VFRSGARLFAALLLLVVGLLVVGTAMYAETPLAAVSDAPHAQPAAWPDAPQPHKAPDPDPVTLHTTPRHILSDQKAIWTSPLRIRDSNAAGPVILVLATAGAITADHQVMSSSRLQDASLNSHASTASNGLVGGFVAVPALLFGLGELRHDSHASEAGILGGEAIVDSLAVNEVIKIVSLRERPISDGARGKFFQSGVGFNSSFPSNHSVVAWSSAAVLAAEYDGRMAQLAIYSLATGVSVTRVLAREHFPSDVLVGSAVGWMIGHYVYKRHHRNQHERDYY
jgi:hypothetical protein